MLEESHVSTPEAAVPNPPPKKSNSKKKKVRRIRNAIIALVVVAALAVGGYFLFQFLNKPEEVNSEIQTDVAHVDSITSSVQGSGNARSKESATITLQNSGIVQKVYVTEGQMVMEGDPLYEIVSPAAQEVYDAAVAEQGKAEDNLAALQEELAELEQGEGQSYRQLAKLRETLAELESGKGQSYKDLEKARDYLAELQSGESDLHMDLANARKELQDTKERASKAESDRFMKAPFAGQLQETKRYIAGDHVSENDVVATLVDDSKFRVPFYFSYAYDGQVTVGQAATVTVRGSDLTGVVEEVNAVRRVSAEGSLLFEAVVVVNNPGALSKGATAGCSLTAADGTLIYPYESGTLDYYRTTQLAAKVGGEVISSALKDYTDVAAGQTVLTLETEDLTQELKAKEKAVKDKQEAIADALVAQKEAVADGEKAIQDALKEARQAVTDMEDEIQDSLKAKQKDITAAQEAVTAAQEKVEEAQKALNDFSAVSPISGTVTSCTLVEGAEVKSDSTVITIANNATMVVTISVDDRNIAYVKPGMGVQLTSRYGDGMTYYGTVTKIDMSLSGDSVGSGMTNYPVTLEVDNADGSLLDGTWLSYSFVTSQSDNCIVVPMQSVKYVSLEDGETSSVVFIQSESKPENAVDIDIPEPMPGQTPDYPSTEEGYYAVPVSTGLSDNYNVEITEGLQGGETVFVNYYVTEAWG